MYPLMKNALKRQNSKNGGNHSDSLHFENKEKKDYEKQICLHYTIDY